MFEMTDINHMCVTDVCYAGLTYVRLLDAKFMKSPMIGIIVFYLTFINTQNLTKIL